MKPSLAGRSALLALALAAGAAPGCGRSPETRDRPEGTRTGADSAFSPPPPPADTVVRAAGYRAVPIRGARAVAGLRKELGRERFLLVLKVNRRDSLHLRAGDTLMVPRDTLAGLLDLAPFPRELPAARGRGKLLLVSRRVQAYAAYEDGKLARWGPTSTGREELPTPAGLYHTNWKDRERTSTFNDEWLLRWYVNLHNFLGISFHQYDLPGYPASHSCVRLLEEDAMWIYAWSEPWKLDPENRRKVLVQGTPVVVFEDYPYGKSPPWERLAADSTATSVPLARIEAALSRHGVLEGWREADSSRARAAADTAARRAG